jgi:hypothetical protein
MTEAGLRDFSIAERVSYLKNYMVSSPMISDFTFSSLFMWADYYSLKLSCFDNLTCIICTGGDFTPSLLMPLGDVESRIKDFIDYYYKWFREQGLDFYISHVDEKYIPLIKSVPGYEYTVTYDRDYSDYIYNRIDFVSMSGSGYKHFRKKIRSFEKHFPDHQYSPLNDADIPECLELIELWREQKGYDADASESAILLRNFKELDLKGGVVKLDGRIKAFLAGELCGDTGFIISGKGDMHIQGLYLYAVREFVKNEFSDALYINRCEDLGIETLRDAKMSCMPVKILHKYNVRCTPV